MALRYLAIGSLALLTAVAASSAVSTLQLNGPRPNLTPGNARLYVTGSRSAQQLAAMVKIELRRNFFNQPVTLPCQRGGSRKQFCTFETVDYTLKQRQLTPIK